MLGLAVGHLNINLINLIPGTTSRKLFLQNGQKWIKTLKNIIMSTIL